MHKSTLAASTALSAVLLAFSNPAFAAAEDPASPAPAATGGPQAASPGQISTTQTDDAGHAPIVVTGRLISGDRDAIVAPVVINGEDLARRAAAQIGSVLAHLPGVSTSGFAPGASRPVLRGFDGPRVQVLTDGLGALDASSVSADHGVAIDTLNVEQIDVLHGPEVLLYAADPAGGAVNALDRRIPRRMPDKPITVNALGAYGSAADSVNLGGAVDVAIAPRLAAHFDASYNRAGDVRIGGDVVSEPLRARLRAEADDLTAAGDPEGAANLTAGIDARGRLANSWARGSAFGAGLAFIDSGGSLGVSVQRLNSDYGIPPRPSAAAPDPVSLSLRQTRYDLRGSVNLGGFFDRLEARVAYGDYTHAEIEDGVAGTRFFNKSIESRFVLTQARHGGWRGESGIQYGTRNFRIEGEPLLPNSVTERIAGFTRQQLSLGPVDLEGSLRGEHVSVKPKGLGPNDSGRSFDLFAAGAGIAWHPLESVTLSLAATHGERAPTAEELYIDGLHDATQSYERGNPAFRIERSNTVEAGLRYHSDRFAGAFTAYATDFSNFIAPIPTGERIEGAPVYQYIQLPAKFRGLEAEGSWKALTWDNGRSLSLESAVDYVHASLTGSGPAPRIPPLRVRGGLTYESDRVGANIEAIVHARQDRVTTYENPVDSYTLLNANVTWRPMGKNGPLALILSGNNLLDKVGRLATSETRDFVPIAGRDIRLTATLKI
ncbi:TonB-dependent receptor [Novosphingobium sp.]|uniref:TonB-dependent receptor n=1 Tax=Novosphingobium sp. TaxID=1874826 RepID=UPI00262A053F|nr:TonB-dependent receptor [Novosphingobium sp.]